MSRSIFTLPALAGLAGCVVPLHHDSGVTAVNEPFDTVVVEVETGSVEILGGTTEAYEVGWDSHWTTRCPDVDMEVSEGVLYVTGRCPAGALGCSTDLLIEAPAGVDVQVAITTGRLWLEGVGAVEAQIATGDMEILGATDQADLEITTGSITGIDLAVDRLRAQVTTGGIDLTLDEPFDLLQAEIVTGEITLGVPHGCYDLDLDVVTGAIDTDGVDCGCDEDATIWARAVTGAITVVGN